MSTAHKEYFNSLADDWDERMPPDPALRDYLIRFGVKGGERILDVGAGTGRMSKYMVELVGDKGCVVAEDIAVRMLSNGKECLGCPPYWVCDDVLDLSFRDAVFDRVVCFSAFPHFTSPVQALREFERVLVKGGRLLILHTRSSHEMNAFHATLDGVVKEDILPDVIAMAGLLEEAGFESEDVFEKDGLYWVTAGKASES